MTPTLPDLLQFFSDIYNREEMTAATQAHCDEQSEALTFEEWEDFKPDYEAAMDECWWAPLVEFMRIGVDIHVGGAWEYDTQVVMLAGAPQDSGDECWLIDGRLLSTYELIWHHAVSWRVR